MNSIPEFHFLENNDDYFLFRYNDGIKVKLYTANETNFIKRAFETTNTSGFNESFYEEFSIPENSKSDEEIFKNAGLQYILPPLSESGSIIKLAREKKIPDLIQPGDIRGIIHCHSN